MENILLVFLNNLKDIEGLNKIIDEFDKRGYKMYLYDSIKDTDFDFTELPDIIQFYKNQFKNINKIVILSNLRDLIFVWYRCYNSIVDDCVYFLDEEENRYFDLKDRHFDFYYSLSNFSNIDNETIEGKIYLSTKDKMHPRYRHKYLDSITNLDYINKTQKRKIKKKYLFNKYEYLFDLNDIKYVSEKTAIKDIKAIKDINHSILENRNFRILVYKGQSQYDVLRVMSDKVIDELRKLGHEVIVIDFLSKNWLQKLNEEFVKKPDFVFSFNAIGIDLKLNNGESIYDELNVPFIGYMVDHPVSLNERIKSKVKNAIFIFCDEENIEYMDSNYPGIKSVFLPLMALSSGEGNIRTKDREIDILFAGSLKNPLDIKESWQTYDSNLTNILECTIDKFLSMPNCLMSHIVEDSIVSYKRKLEEKDYLKLKEVIYFNIENYVRNYRRYELLSELAKAKLTVHCYTNNIDELQKINIYNTFRIEHSVPFADLLKLLGNSKIVVNISAQIFSGISERVLSSMINGAIALTDNNYYIDKEFHNGYDILLYDKDQMSAVSSIIKNYINNQKKLQEISSNGMCKAQQGYNPNVFVKKVLDLFNSI